MFGTLWENLSTGCDQAIRLTEIFKNACRFGVLGERANRRAATSKVNIEDWMQALRYWLQTAADSFACQMRITWNKTYA